MSEDIFGPKDPDDVDDFFFDWAKRLGTGETISTAAHAVIDASPGAPVTISAESATATVSKVRLVAGVRGSRVKVRCRVTTTLGRVLDHTENFVVNER